SSSSSGDIPIPATAIGAADAATNQLESAVTQRTEEMRPPAASAPPSDGHALVVTGRVLDERRRPVAGCDVALLRVTATAARARSDEAGRFLCSMSRLDAVDRAATSLFALAADGRCAVAWVDLARSRDDEASPGDPID